MNRYYIELEIHDVRDREAFEEAFRYVLTYGGWRNDRPNTKLRHCRVAEIHTRVSPFAPDLQFDEPMAEIHDMLLKFECATGLGNIPLQLRHVHTKLAEKIKDVMGQDKDRREKEENEKALRSE